MTESGGRDPDLGQPAPTHWNVPRDPRKSFLCPLCGARVQLRVIHGTNNKEVAAMCFGCRTAMLADTWNEHKAMEIRNGT